jgi:hypothetical protein
MEKDKIKQCLLKRNYHAGTERVRMIAQCFSDLAPKWISVNDRLPETHREYTVYDGSDTYDCLLLNTKWNTLSTVTHWRNKPLPPSEGE